MDYPGLVKKLALPDGYTPPTELAYDDIRARAISRADLDDDVREGAPPDRRDRPRLGIAELRASVAENLAATEGAEIRRIGSDFHLRLVELTSNRSLVLFARLISGLLDGALPRHDAERRKQRMPSQSTGMIDHHSRIIDLIEAGASREAARYWREHLEAVHQQPRKSINTDLVLDLES